MISGATLHCLLISMTFVTAKACSFEGPKSMLGLPNGNASMRSHIETSADFIERFLSCLPMSKIK